MLVPERYLADSRDNKRICVYATNNVEYIKGRISDHGERDSFDSYCIFQFQIIRAIRRYGEGSPDAEVMEFMSNIHLEKMSSEFFAKEMALLSLVTSIDIVRHGESLCKQFLRE